MSTMVTKAHDALVEAGASEDKARKAAAVARKRRFAEIKGDLKLPKWMQGATVAGIVALLLRAFAH